jgi:predicted nicotinamide N-methyase
MVSTDSVTDSPIPGGWAEREVCVGPHRLRLVLPAEPDELLEQFEAEYVAENEEPELFWAQLWPSALPMAQAVLNADWPAGAAVLELGCGIGIVGLIALSCGYQVTFSDGVALAVRLAAENARRNGLVHFRSIQMDWRKPTEERFPVIIGSDVLYDRQNHELLLRVLDAMLQQDGVCWLGDPGRYHTPAFVQRAKDCGFTVRLRDETGADLREQQPGCFQMIVLQRTAR